MTNIVQKYEQELVKKLGESKQIPNFKPGDTLKVTVAIPNSSQDFQGVCIAVNRSKDNVHCSFVVRKLSHGVAVERKFPLYSPKVLKIERLKRGKVRRAKLYYLRDLRGKAARIKEDKSDK